MWPGFYHAPNTRGTQFEGQGGLNDLLERARCIRMDINRPVVNNVKKRHDIEVDDGEREQEVIEN